MVILSIVPPLKLALTVTLAMHEMSTVPLWVTVTTTVEASPVAVVHGELVQRRERRTPRLSLVSLSAVAGVGRRGPAVKLLPPVGQLASPTANRVDTTLVPCGPVWFHVSQLFRTASTVPIRSNQ